MPSRAPAEAVEVYRAGAARLLSCVASAHVDVGGGYQPDAIPHRLTLAGGDPVRLRGEGPLTLDVSQHYRLAEQSEGWTVEVVAYFYVLGYAGRELLAYHWHPRGLSRITGRHLHVHGDRQLGERWLGKLHLPTGSIRLEEIVGLAIEELGAEPLRSDWRDVLGRKRA